MGVWSGRCERGVTGWSVKIMEESEDGTLGAVRKTLIFNKIATFRVAKTPTLKVA